MTKKPPKSSALDFGSMSTALSWHVTMTETPGIGQMYKAREQPQDKNMPSPQHKQIKSLRNTVK
jgi:hypothetical protein